MRLPMWVARIMLMVVMAAHGGSKITQTGEFTAKFDLSPTVTALAAAAELSAIVGLAYGGAAERSTPRVALAASWLAVANIAIVQIGAIITVHWINGYWYYQSGVEYNLVLLALCLIVASGAWELYRHERKARDLVELMQGRQ